MISKGADVIIVIDMRLPVTSSSVHHITGHVFCIHAFFSCRCFWKNSGKGSSRMNERWRKREEQRRKLILVRSMMESQAN